MDFNVAAFFQNDLVNAGIRVFTIVFLILFILYSLLTLRQVSIMNHSLSTKLALEIQLLAWFQLILGVSALGIIAFFI